MAALIIIVLLSAWSYPERTQFPTVAADAVTIKEGRRASEIGIIAGPGDPRDALVVERPVGAMEGAKSSVFVVDADLLLRRVAVEYGGGSPSLIQIVRGVSPGDRVIVSDMRAWDAFERVRLRLR